MEEDECVHFLSGDCDGDCDCEDCEDREKTKEQLY